MYLFWDEGYLQEEQIWPFLAPGAQGSRWVMLTHQTLCHKLMRPVVNESQDTWADIFIREKEDLEASIPVFQDHKSGTGWQGEEFNWH